MTVRINSTVVAASVGSADTAEFLFRRLQLFRTARGRAFGTAAGLALWTTVAVRAAAEGEHSSTPTLAMTAALVAGNAAMLAVHVRHGIAGPRIFVGAAASVVTLADTIRRR